MTKIDQEKKVLIIGQAPPPIGGVTVHIGRLLESLKRDCIPYRHLDPKHTGLRDFFKDLEEIKKVHINISNPFIKLLLASTYRVLRKEVILTIHGELGHFKGFFDLFDYMSVIVSSKALLLNKRSYYRARKYKKNVFLTTAFIPPVDRESYAGDTALRKKVIGFTRNYKRSFCTNAYNVAKDGNGNEIYGLSGLVKLFQKHKDLGLIISEPSGNYMEYLKTHGVSIPENVMFLSQNHNFLNVLELTDCLLRATTTDGDSVSVREAIWLNKKVICSDCVERPEGCILYKTLNWKDLEDKIVRLDEISQPNINSGANAYELLKDIYTKNVYSGN